MANPVTPNTLVIGDTVYLGDDGSGSPVLPAVDGSSLVNLPGFNYDHLVSGGASWESGLTYNVTNLVYIIGGTQYTSVGTQVTLAAADVTNDRIDVIYADVNGNVGVVTGTPSAS